LSVTPEQFASQVSIIRRQARPVALRDLDTLGNKPGLPAIAVTFDDGYEDNLLEAEPLLRQFDIPATMFVVSEAIGNPREFWWDELERIVFERRKPSGPLEVAIRNTWRTWTLDENSCSCNDTDWQAWQPVGDCSCPHRAYSELYRLLFPVTVDCRREILANMRTWAGLGDRGRSSHRTLSREQLRALSQSPLVDIGAHSVTHASLAALPVSAQRDEIAMSRQNIEALIERSPISFSYPFGKQEHFSTETVNTVRLAGFRYACTNIPGRVRDSTDALRLPRFIAPRLEGKAFAQWLSGCLNERN
jgi:peptidoglycan/xylan/chitin deacetylase (PgdA/CDA1 family)